MVKLSQLGDDLSIRENGAPFYPDSRFPDFVMYVRSINSQKAQKILRSLPVEEMRDFAVRISGQIDLHDQAVRQQTARIVCVALVDRWEGVEDGDYTPALGEALLGAVESIGILRRLIVFCQSSEPYRKQREEIEGNSGASSDSGSASTTRSESLRTEAASSTSQT